MSRAVCSRCGGDKADYAVPCPACGLRPSGEGLVVAWLLSSQHLDGKGLDAAAARIRSGDSVRPGRAQLERARRAMGSTLGTDPGLTTLQRVLLLLTCLALTPLPAWVMGLWWVRTRPRASVQALALALPTSVLFTALGLWGLLGGF